MTSTSGTPGIEERIKLLVDRLGYFPSREFFLRHPYFESLVESLEHPSDGRAAVSLEEHSRQYGPDYFRTSSVPIPSARQMLVGSTIAHDGFHYSRKKLEMSIPGSQKTGAVLCAVDLINRKYLQEQRVKTIYATPGTIVRTMFEEAQRFLPDYRKVCITQQNREEDIERAREADIIFLGYELSFRRTRFESQGEGRERLGRRYFELLKEIPTLEEAQKRLRRMASDGVVGATRAEDVIVKNQDWSKMLMFIAQQELRQEATSVVEMLQEKVLVPDQPYYVILGEAHNLVDDQSKTAQALSELFRQARWGVLETGTAVRNNISQMSYLMYLLGFVDKPGDFPRIVKNDPRRVKSALELYLLPPVISNVQQIDASVPLIRENIVHYDPYPEELDAHLALLDSELFTGPERLYLDQLLISCPPAFHPDRFDPECGKGLYARIHEFFQENPDVVETLERVPSSRIEATRKLILEATERGEKSLVFCEHDITDYLFSQLQDLGARKIDARLSLDLETDGYSQRDLALLEAAVNPEVNVLIATRGTLREGKDAREFTNIVTYEETTVPFRESQSIARAYRSGQRRVVTINRLYPQGIETVEGVVGFRKWKEYLGEQVYAAEPTPEEVDAYLKDVSAFESPQLSTLLNIKARGQLYLIFRSLRGVGSEEFAQRMAHAQNARLLSKQFNAQWDYTYSANCARLLGNVIQYLENRDQVSLEEILDGASGPSTVSRMLKRPTTSLDLLRLQLEYGQQACEEITGNRYFLGSIHNLQRMVNLENCPDEVFVPSKNYEKEERISDASLDLYVCSLAFYYLNPIERESFFQEAYRALKDDRYLILLMPRSRISPQCEKKFLQDMQDSGFEMDLELTGEYSARRSQNVETGEYGSGSGFNPYVIVARKLPLGQPEERERFVLEVGFEVVDSKPSARAIERALDISRKPRMIYSDFYRKQDALHPDVKSINQYLAGLRPRESEDLLDALARLSEELES